MELDAILDNLSDEEQIELLELLEEEENYRHTHLLINMYQSGERLTKTIEEKKSVSNYEVSHAHNDLVESLDRINKRLDETNMLLKQIQNEVEKR